MIKEVIIGKDIYPDITTEMFDELTKLEKIYGISVEFLLDEGVKFSYDTEKVSTKNYPGDISFYGLRNNLLITFEETFGELEFRDINDEVIITIPIFEREYK